jgi:hypothetical protein
MVYIGDLPKDRLFMELILKAKRAGLQGETNYPESITSDEAKATLISHPGFIGNIYGRVFSLDLSKDYLNPKSFDRHNGKKGLVQEIADDLRVKLKKEAVILIEM